MFTEAVLRKPDRRRKPAPRWGPPTREPSIPSRIGEALRLASTLKKAETP